MILADFRLTKINMREGVNNRAPLKPFTVRPVRLVLLLTTYS